MAHLRWDGRTTMEDELQELGVKWKNYGLQLYQEETGLSDEEIQEKLAAWMNIPEIQETKEEILSKVKDLGSVFLARMIKAEPTPPNIKVQSASKVIAAGGILRVVKNKLPHPAFEEGLEHKVTHVFSQFNGNLLPDGSFTGGDARNMQGVGAQMKFPDLDFDLHLLTGMGLSKDFQSHMGFFLAPPKPPATLEGCKDLVRGFMRSNPVFYFGLMERPSWSRTSYTKQVMSSQFPIALAGTDGSKMYIKFRLLPPEGETIEMMTEEEQKNYLTYAFPQPEGTDSRDPNFLQKDLEERINSNDGVKMRLQVKTADQSEATDLGFFHPLAMWPNSTWQTVGVLQLTELLDVDTYWRKIKHAPSNLLEGMSIIPCVSTKEPNFINHAREIIYRSVQNTREILLSTACLESQARAAGHNWTNRGRTLFQQMTGQTDNELAWGIAEQFNINSEPEAESQMKEKIETLQVDTIMAEICSNLYRRRQMCCQSYFKTGPPGEKKICTFISSLALLG